MNKMVHVDCLSRSTDTINIVSMEDKVMYKQMMDLKLKKIACVLKF